MNAVNGVIPAEFSLNHLPVLIEFYPLVFKPQVNDKLLLLFTRLMWLLVKLFFDSRHEILEILDPLFILTGSKSSLALSKQPMVSMGFDEILPW